LIILINNINMDSVKLTGVRHSIGSTAVEKIPQHPLT